MLQRYKKIYNRHQMGTNIAKISMWTMIKNVEYLRPQVKVIIFLFSKIWNEKKLNESAGLLWHRAVFATKRE